MLNSLLKLENKVKASRLGREPSLGCFLLSASSLIAEAMATQPIEWLILDMEASHASKADVLHFMQALNGYDVMPFVRVPNHDKHHIEASLDLGARGVVVPKVDTPEQAAEVTAACFYPPKGTRGMNCVRASSYYTQGAQYLSRANDVTLSIVQIESKESVENAFAIARVPTVDAMFVGPGDLSTSYGQMGRVTGGKMDAARAKVLAACREHRKIPGIFAHSVEAARQYIEEGFTIVAIGNDVKHLCTGLSDFLSQVKSRTDGEERGANPTGEGG